MNAKTVFWTGAMAIGVMALFGYAVYSYGRHGLRIDFSTLSRFEVPVTNGVTLVKFVSREKPCRAYLVRIDLRTSGLRMCVEQGEHSLATRATVDRMAKIVEARTGLQPLAGLNGDLFNLKFDPASHGNPVGVSVSDGRLFTSGWRHAVDSYESLCTFENGRPEIVRLTFRGTIRADNGTRLTFDAYNAAPFKPDEAGKAYLVYYDANWTAPLPDDGILLELSPKQHGRAIVAGHIAKGSALSADGRHAALVGFGARRNDAKAICGSISINMALVDERGRTPVNAVRISARPLVAGEKRPTMRGMRNNYPRSLIGLGEDIFAMFVADGRKPFYSEGMLAEDAAEILRREGCTEVGEMDGGGSATLWLGGEYVNNPSDLFVRRVSNGIFFLPSDGP